mmetsp:Transcript_81814/g.252650  ORF Transcript_81814/g.252650 Transcript_81814/m.252650 type:complete len:375 (+) Transcript_81814:482-1606(+)
MGATLRRPNLDLPPAHLGRHLPPTVDFPCCLLEASGLAIPPGLQQLQLVANLEVLLPLLLRLLGVELPLPGSAAVRWPDVLAALRQQLPGFLQPLAAVAGSRGRGRRRSLPVDPRKEGVDLAGLLGRERWRSCLLPAGLRRGGGLQRLGRLPGRFPLLRGCLLLLKLPPCLLRGRGLLRRQRPAFGDLLLGLLFVLLLHGLEGLLGLLGRPSLFILLVAHLLEELVHHLGLLRRKAHLVVGQRRQRRAFFWLRPRLRVTFESLEALLAVQVLGCKGLRDLREVAGGGLPLDGLLQLRASRLGPSCKLLVGRLLHECPHLLQQLDGLVAVGVRLDAPLREVLRLAQAPQLPRGHRRAQEGLLVRRPHEQRSLRVV